MTMFPKAEERLRPLLDAYVAIARQHTGIADFMPPDKRGLYAAARELAEELNAYHVGENDWEKFMWFAYKEYKRRFNGPFKDHRSIKFLVKEFKGTPDDTSKYLKGVYDE